VQRLDRVGCGREGLTVAVRAGRGGVAAWRRQGAGLRGAGGSVRLPWLGRGIAPGRGLATPARLAAPAPPVATTFARERNR
jgi:hypothetical protein